MRPMWQAANTRPGTILRGIWERPINHVTTVRNPFRSLPCALSEAMNLRLADVAVDVAPAAIVAADEAAEFVQAVSAAAHFISCDEFDFGVGLVLRSEGFNLQA
jgi:hypothetical protein